MKKRPAPTINLILEMLGEDSKLLKKTYKGLNEVSLRGLYPNLNLDEAIAFAAISWGDRWRDIRQYSKEVDQMDLYAIVNRAMGRGMAALNGAKKISEKNRSIYDRLNPFQGGLRERLERVPEQDEAVLREAIKQPAKYYASEGQYMAGHARRNADEEGRQLVVMQFLPVYLKNANPVTVNMRYATEIARMFRTYTTVTAEPAKNPGQLFLL